MRREEGRVAPERGELRGSHLRRRLAVVGEPAAGALRNRWQGRELARLVRRARLLLRVRQGLRALRRRRELGRRRRGRGELDLVRVRGGRYLGDAVEGEHSAIEASQLVF